MCGAGKGEVVPQSKYSGFRTRSFHEEANNQDSLLSFVQIFSPFFLIFSIFLPKSVLKLVKMRKRCSVDMTVQEKMFIKMFKKRCLLFWHNCTAPAVCILYMQLWVYISFTQKTSQVDRL